VNERPKPRKKLGQRSEHQDVRGKADDCNPTAKLIDDSVECELGIKGPSGGKKLHRETTHSSPNCSRKAWGGRDPADVPSYQKISPWRATLEHTACTRFQAYGTGEKPTELVRLIYIDILRIPLLYLFSSSTDREYETKAELGFHAKRTSKQKKI